MRTFCLVMMLAGFVAVSAVADAAPAPPAVSVNCARTPGALQPALDAVAPGTVVRVEGRCVGTFTISQDLTLEGKQGATLDGGGNGPVVTVVAGVYVVLDNLLVTGANNATVGGIRNSGHLTLTRTRVIGNRAIGATGFMEAVGGILSGPAASATLIVNDAQVSDNHATFVTAVTTTVGAIGGIRADGAVHLTQVEVRANTASMTAGGNNRAFGGVAASSAGLTLDRVVISDNVANSVHTGLTGTGLVAGAVGGLVRINATGAAQIDRTAIQNNRATARSLVGSAAAGGLNIRNATLRRTQVTGNSAEAGTLASGGFNNFDNLVKLEGSVVSGNTATATDVNGIAAGGILTGTSLAPLTATTTLIKTRVTRNEAFGAVGAGGLYEVPGKGSYVFDRATIDGNAPTDCSFACVP